MNATIEARRTLMVRADQLVAGLFVTSELVGDDGESHEQPPLAVTGVERVGGMVAVTYGNGWRIRYDLDELVEMVCIDAPDPAWCVDHDTTVGEGTVRHATAPVVLPGLKGGEPDVYAVLSRWDDPDGSVCEPPAVSLVVGRCAVELTPEIAVELGRALVHLGLQAVTS